MAEDQIAELNPTLERVKMQKQSAFNYRERRHGDWNENYTLYRDKVLINRLTQRQSINIPLMKGILKTVIKDIDDPPMIHFEDKGNDSQKEVFYNEYWKFCSRRNRLILRDIVDKKQVLLYGRSFKKLNIVNGLFFHEIIDPQDILIDRYVDPVDIDSARYLHHINIYKPLASIEVNTAYDKSAIAQLRDFYSTEAGLIKTEDNTRAAMEKNQKMQDMGQTDTDNPILGETYVEINENYEFRFDEKRNRDIIWLTVTADDMVVLLEKPLHKVIGNTPDDFWHNHYPYTTWADDIERTDFWSDGVADSIRPINKVLNSWISQLVENRTLRNFGMQYYNSSLEGFVPQTFEPVPWGWYPVPGNPNETVQRIEVPDLSESLDEVQYLISIAEKASAASAASQGVVEQQKVTLGEIQLALSNARDRTMSMAIFYTEAWQDFGQKYIKLLEASPRLLDEVDIDRRGLRDMKVWREKVSPKDWASKAGYRVSVTMIGDRVREATESIQKMNVAITEMPANPALREIYRKKLLEFSGLTADEIDRVMENEKLAQERAEAMPEMPMVPGDLQPIQPPAGPPDQPPAPLVENEERGGV